MSNDISKMNDKQLRNEVQLLRDELAIMKRKYEDIIYNLDTDNFSSRFVKEQGDMRTAIEVTAEGIKTKVSNEEFESTKTQLADRITSEVKKLNDADGDLSSEISQTASEIRSVVSKNISVKFESDDRPTKLNTTTAEKGMLCEYNDTLYYYNDITETWKVYPYADEVKSQFIQTDDGFEITGDVSVRSQDYKGNEVLISDGNIKLFPWNYSDPIISFSMWNRNNNWVPAIKLGRGTDSTGEVGVGWIIKDEDTLRIEYVTSDGKSLYIEFDDTDDTIHIVGDVEFDGTVALPGGIVGGGSGGVAVFG